MKHDCSWLCRQLDDWPLLTADQRGRLAEAAADCERCSAELNSARQLAAVLESGRQQYQELRYRGPKPDLGAVLDEVEENRPPVWRRRATRWLLPLAALLMLALGLRLAWTGGALHQEEPGAPDRSLAKEVASVGAGSLVLTPPPAPPPPTISVGGLAAGGLRRPAPPAGGRSLTFSSPPRPSNPAGRNAEAAATSAIDDRQGDRS